MRPGSNVTGRRSAWIRLSFYALFFFFPLSITPTATPEEPVVRLTSDSSPVTRKLAAGETHTYSIELKANEIVDFRFEKEDLRFVFNATDPEGVSVFRGNFQRYGTAEGWFVTDQEGTYKFEIASLEKSAAGDQYKFALTPRRGAQTRDLTLFEAEKTFQKAEELRNGWAAASLESARKLYAETAETWLRHKQWKRAADSYEQIGEIYLIFGNYRASLEAYKSSLRFSRAANHKDLALRGSCNIVKINILLGNLSAAQADSEDVKKAIERVNPKVDSVLSGIQINNAGEISYAKGIFKEARPLFEKALKIFQNLHHRSGEAAALLNLGHTNIDSGEIVAARNDLEQSLALWRELGDLRGEAFTLTAQGHLLSFNFRWEEALSLHKSEALIFEFIGDRQGEAVALNGMGFVNEILNRPSRAVSSYTKALKINDELGNKSSSAVTSFALARSYRMQKDFANAEHYYQASLKLSRQINKARVVVYILSHIAAMNLDLGRAPLALEWYRQTLSFYKKIGDSRGEALAHGEIGNIFQKQGKLDLASDKYLTALKLNRKVGDQLAISDTLYHLAEVDLKRENLPRSLSLIEESVAMTDKMRAKLRNPVLRTAYQSSVQNKIELQIDVLMRMYRNDPQQRLIKETLELVERSRARTLREILSEARIEPRSIVNQLLLDQETELEKKRNDKIEENMLLQVSPGSSEKLKGLELEIAALNADYDRIQTEIRSQDPRYENLVNPPIADLAGIQDSLGKEKDTVYLSYVLGSQNAYVWLVANDDLKVFDLGDRATLEDSAQEVYKLLSQRHPQTGEEIGDTQKRVEAGDKQFCRKSLELGRRLLEPVAPFVSGKRLLVSLDGALQYVPFEALPAPGSLSTKESLCNEVEMPLLFRPLLETNEVVYLPSFSVLKNLRQSKEQGTDASSNDEIAVWADPVYEPEDSRLIANNARPAPPASGAISLEKADLPTVPLRRLLSTQIEADQIIGLWPKDKGVQFSGFDVNRAALGAPTLTRYRFLHIAVHGLYDNAHPENSGLWLSRFDKNGFPGNGFFSLQDIFQMRLTADLVVLSACQTGLGEEFSGEGLTGLKQGLFHAGAKSALISLWQVDDQATASLMREFYMGFLEKGLSSPAALRYAKLEIYHQKGWERPYYWAAFTLNGEYLTAAPAPPGLFSNYFFVSFIIILSVVVIFAGLLHIKRKKVIFRSSKKK